MKKLLKILPLISVIFFSCSSSKESTDEKVKGLFYDPPGSTNTTDKVITKQDKKIYKSEQGIYVSNDFEGGRLNNFYKVDEKIFFAEILPENAPINNSAWYSFKIWSDKEQMIQLVLFYEEGDHRYYPKLSNDGKVWQNIDSSNYKPDELTGTAVLSLNIGKDTLWVSGQELLTSSDYDKWTDDLEEKSFIEKSTIGLSSEKRKINMLKISEAPDDADFIFIIGRLHPPEVTGALALKAFTEMISSEVDRAEIFRKNFKTFVVPLVNPDGVDLGHWRHNANGIDLNRDWYYFNQPEPALIKNALLEINEASAGKLKFFIDFHSTQVDVFYITSRDTTLPMDINYDLTKTWLEEIGKANPGYKVNIDESLSNPDSPTSDSWAIKVFKIPGVTYEVGDETDRAVIKKVAGSAALSLMKLLLEAKQIKK